MTKRELVGLNHEALAARLAATELAWAIAARTGAEVSVATGDDVGPGFERLAAAFTRTGDKATLAEHRRPPNRSR